MSAFTDRVKQIIVAYENGQWNSNIMPEESNPGLHCKSEENRVYFTLPMALNYQRNSYKLWESALATYNDVNCRRVFHLAEVVEMSDDDLRKALSKYKLALQPNNHVKIWRTCAASLHCAGGLNKLFNLVDHDILKLKKFIQLENKKGFPYLSGPKIFNYWTYIMELYCCVKWKNREYIEIAPDTHVVQASVKLGLITETEAHKASRDWISQKWRDALAGSGMAPIDVHSPLWFWSRAGFPAIE